MSEDIKNTPRTCYGDTIVETIRSLGGMSRSQNLSSLRDCFSQLDVLLKPPAPSQQKDPRKRLCPLVRCSKCHKSNVTLYRCGGERICKKCKEEQKL